MDGIENDQTLYLICSLLAQKEGEENDDVFLKKSASVRKLS